MATAMGNLSDQTKGEEPSDFLNKQKDAVEDADYVEPMQDPYNKAITYLENHNILQLFQTLTAGIVYHKPEKPLEYMMLEVEKMKKEKATTK
ncbi:testis-specific expressed protein 55-like [Mya arenaria]|nr:testis-specific expressed protein 55-like [Mya arenaria]